MLYLIGLGLNVQGISLEGLNVIKLCSLVYLENYTVNFPYSISQLEEALGTEIVSLDRTEVESLKVVKEAKNQDVALLVYGCPLFATTHQTILEDCIKEKVSFKVIYSASVFDSLAECGLQLYKFGKITSMPKWQKSFTPASFMDVVKENESIKAHSLILVDIGLECENAILQLKEASETKDIKIKNIIVASNMGTENPSIIYSNLDNLLKDRKLIESVKMPFCFIIPSALHFMEEEALKKFLLG